MKTTANRQATGMRLAGVLSCLVVAFLIGNAARAGARPNVVLIMSDDQGYGDFGATGNKVFDTPHIDALARGSASMTTFYVSPVCSPTRACLMTGRYNYRTRCIDTYLGRSMMEPAEVTIAEVLRQAGYATGIFGKWHLGDNYPLRAMDQGFQETLVHKGGGLAQASEPLENGRRYTDAILFHNGRQVETTGYCTDVYFEGALKFIEQAKADRQNFFVYLPTNAPHSPFHDVPEDLYHRYLQKDLSSIMLDDAGGRRGTQNQDVVARIAAMITNIDDNVGHLMDKLHELSLADNTIVIIMVDNGPNSTRYVGPFRGSKNNVHDGGVRSPFWMHWPAELNPGATSDKLAAHIDVMPTILDACEVPVPAGVKLDGRSFLPLLRGERVTWPERHLALQAHRGNKPVRYHHFLIRDQRWKLLHPSGFSRESFEGEPRFELYDLAADPAESNNLVDQRTDVFQRLKHAYDDWFDDVSSTRKANYAPPRIHVGTPHENPTVLTRQDWRVDADRRVGHWELQVASAGTYDIRLVFDALDEPGYADLVMENVRETLPIEAGAKSCTFEAVELKQGHAALSARVSQAGDPRGAYHVFVTKR